MIFLPTILIIDHIKWS